MPSTPSTPAVLTSRSRPVSDTNDRNLLLTGFTGQVLRYFEDTAVVSPFLGTMAIDTGDESAQILATGKLNAFYMKRGDELSGQDFRVSDRYIHVDEPIVSPFELWDFDQMLMRPDLSGQMAEASGEALSRKFDLDATLTAIRGSLVYGLRCDGSNNIVTPQDSTYFSGATPMSVLWSSWEASLLDSYLQPGIQHQGGLALHTSASYGDPGTRSVANAFELYEAIVRIDYIMDESNLPTNGRYFFCRLADFDNMVNARYDGTSGTGPASFNFVNKEIFAGLGGSGPRQRAVQIGNITVIPVNESRLPKTNVNTTNTTVDTNAIWPEPKYAANLSKCLGFAVTEGSAVNIIKMGVSMESERDVRRQSDFTVAKMLGGHDVVRPEGLISLWTHANGDLSSTVATTTAATGGLKLTGAYDLVSDHATSIFRSKDSTAGAISSTPTAGE